MCCYHQQNGNQKFSFICFIENFWKRYESTISFCISCIIIISIVEIRNLILYVLLKIFKKKIWINDKLLHSMYYYYQQSRNQKFTFLCLIENFQKKRYELTINFCISSLIIMIKIEIRNLVLYVSLKIFKKKDMN